MNTEYKKMTSHGSISIPVAMRRDLGIEPRDPMIVERDGGGIRIRPYTPRCVFCGAEDGVKEFHGRGICGRCAALAVQRTGGGNNGRNRDMEGNREEGDRTAGHDQ